MLKIFKPSWIVIEFIHERGTFDSYYSYCRHMTLKEVEEMFMLNEIRRDIDRNGCYKYDNSEHYNRHFIIDKDEKTVMRFTQYFPEFTIVMPVKNRNKDQYFILGETKNKHGLFDMENIEHE